MVTQAAGVEAAQLGHVGTGARRGLWGTVVRVAPGLESWLHLLPAGTLGGQWLPAQVH